MDTVAAPELWSTVLWKPVHDPAELKVEANLFEASICVIQEATMRLEPTDSSAICFPCMQWPWSEANTAIGAWSVRGTKNKAKVRERGKIEKMKGRILFKVL